MLRLENTASTRYKMTIIGAAATLTSAVLRI